MKMVVAYIRQNLRNSLTIEKLAAVANLSPRQFSRAFLAETGQSPARAVERLRLEAARNQADANVALGTAEGNVILLKKQAEAEPLRQQVAAFGDGNAYAQYFFYQKIAGSVKSVLTNTDGPFGEMFKQFVQPPGANGKNSPGAKVTEVRQ